MERSKVQIGVTAVFIEGSCVGRFADWLRLGLFDVFGMLLLDFWEAILEHFLLVCLLRVEVSAHCVGER